MPLHAYSLDVVLIPKHKDAWRIKFAVEVLIWSALPAMVSNGHQVRSRKNPDIAPTAVMMFHRRKRPPSPAAFGRSGLVPSVAVASLFYHFVGQKLLQ